VNFLIVLGGSSVAILLIWIVSRALGLGGDVRLSGRDAALQLAEADGFIATDAVVDRAGIGAIARDADGRHLLIRRHGVHFVTRLLRAPLDARLDQNFLTLGTGERSFGRITFDLGGEASNWAASLRQVR
jgi:hypothetical protein